jgi:hypothetical protein
MAFIGTDQQFQEETTSQVLRIMMFSRQMSDCRQSDTKWFAIPANLFGTQPVRPQNRQHLAGLVSVIQIASDLNLANTGLQGEESSYPLRS